MKGTSAKKNFLYQSLYEVLALIIPLITSPYIARVLGTEKLGIYSYTYTVANYFVLFACLGVKNYGNRSIAKVRNDKKKLNQVFSELYSLMVLIAIFVSCIYLCVICKMEYTKIAVVQSLCVFSCLFDVSWFFFGIENFKLVVVRNFIIKILTVVCVFIFVKNENDLWKYSIIMAGGVFFSQFALWIFLKKYVIYKRPRFKEMMVHFKPLCVLFVPALAISIYKYMDKIMLGVMSTKSQVAFYENAEKVSNIVLSIISSFGTVMLPKISNVISNGDEKKARRYLNISMEYIMCFACALTFGLAAVSEEFSIVFWGEEFMETGFVLKVLSTTIPFIAFANVLRTQYLIPKNKDKEYVVSVILGAVINVIINSLLIPKSQANGAAIGTVCAEATVCLVQMWYVRKELPVGEYIKKTIPFLGIGMMMWIVVTFVRTMVNAVGIISLCIQIVSGVGIYVVAVIIYFIFYKNPMLYELINQLKRRRK